MTAIYKVLSALISYPTPELQAAAPEIAALIAADHDLLPAQRVTLAAFAEEIEHGDLLELQSRYVDLFDRSRSLSLYLFEHIHGESRERGQAMVDLRERYRIAGLDIAANELPDFFPLFLEFLSVCPAAEARQMLGDVAHVLRAVGERLTSRDSPYGAIFAALETLAAAAPDPVLLDEMQTKAIDDPADLAALDRAWEEAEVRFGAGDAQTDGCPRVATPRRLIPAVERAL
jgi:nitrate reductase delta subunit